MLLLTLRETGALKRLSSFKNLRRKGGKFDHRPGRPKVLLHRCTKLKKKQIPDSSIMMRRKHEADGLFSKR